MNIFFTCLLISLLLSNCGLVLEKREEKLNGIDNWAILLNYDSSKNIVNYDELNKFDMLIFDADAHPNLSRIHEDIILIAYVSIGEAEDYRHYWDDKFAESYWIIGENENWEGNYYVDIRTSQWQDLVLYELIKDVEDQGFDGIFMDSRCLQTSVHTNTAFQNNGFRRFYARPFTDSNNNYLVFRFKKRSLNYFYCILCLKCRIHLDNIVFTRTISRLRIFPINPSINNDSLLSIKLQILKTRIPNLCPTTLRLSSRGRGFVAPIARNGVAPVTTIPIDFLHPKGI